MESIPVESATAPSDSRIRALAAMDAALADAITDTPMSPQQDVERAIGRRRPESPERVRIGCERGGSTPTRISFAVAVARQNGLADASKSGFI